MITKKSIRINASIDHEIICDSCGKSCYVHEHVIDNPANSHFGNVERVFEYMELKAAWGYHSNKDTQIWTAQICEQCVDNKLSALINFKKDRYM